jgi:REP element-mobilizing transposase RayT
MPMPEEAPLFRGAYRVPSARFRDGGYGAAGWYFVTVCTHNHSCVLGDVVDGAVRLSKPGEIAAHEWQKTEHVRPDIQLDAWCIMPNHIHGIIVINKADPTVEMPRWGVSEGIERSRLKPNSLG